MGDYEKIQEEGKFQVGADIPEITFNEVGKRGVRRLDGYEKASGKAVYNRDIQMPGMLYARILSSPYPRAKILHMDTSKAEALPGVRSIIRYDDPAVKDRDLNGSYFAPEWVNKPLGGWALKPIHKVLGDEAFYEGQPLGVAVAADTEDIALEALGWWTSSGRSSPLCWIRRKPSNRMRPSCARERIPTAFRGVIWWSTPTMWGMWRRGFGGGSHYRVQGQEARPPVGRRRNALRGGQVARR